MTGTQCISCLWKYPAGPGCAAFPDGIPGEILSGLADHSKPYKGDGGFRFKEFETVQMEQLQTQRAS